MTAVFQGTNNEVDEYTTKYFAKSMRKQNISSLIMNLGAEVPTLDGKQKQPSNQEQQKKAEVKYKKGMKVSTDGATYVPPEEEEEVDLGGLFE